MLCMWIFAENARAKKQHCDQKLLNKNLKADILVNGFRTDKINIEQSVKQGDALSCSLFILCMDPLIRKLNADETLLFQWLFLGL